MTEAPQEPAPGPAPEPAAGVADGTWHRVHPLTPAVRSWQVIAVLLVVVLQDTGQNALRQATGSGEGHDERLRRAAAGKSKAAIEKVFSPEFRNRLDAIVTFRTLSPSVMEQIVALPGAMR